MRPATSRPNVDALGHGQTYAYDALGRAITVGDALGHATTYTYDGGGRFTSTVDRNGKTTGFSLRPIRQLGRAVTFARWLLAELHV